ncbi:coilin [Scaptodrosophila lebanonensis]|uniref:Coilin n=1 Tax=Drosophila lebanonensis TaxID=7225 RepID=A0A6J2UG95_DROLE|nr:coilin [Scaptodrosophila lebanonensis]
MQYSAIKVDLSDFFSDKRKCSLLLIDPEWKTIVNLIQHIEHLFHLGNISLLTNDGCFLPPQESIKVLFAHSTESLKAFVLDVCDNENSSNVQPKLSQKRKNRSIEDTDFTSSTPNQPKRSKNGSIVSLPPESYIDDDRQHVQDASIDSKSCLAGQARSQPQTSTACADKSMDVEINITQREITRNGANESKISRKSKKSAKLNGAKVNDSTNSHIIFNDDDTASTTKDTSAATESIEEAIKFRCPLMEVDPNKPRIFKLPHKLKQIKILENILLAAPPPSKEKEESTYSVPLVNEGAIKKSGDEQSMDEGEQLSDAVDIIENIEKSISPPIQDCTEGESTQIYSEDSDDSVMVLDDTKVDSDPDVVPVSAGEDHDMIRDLLLDSIPLTALPRVGDTTLFKIPKQKGCKKSGFTNYIAGVCSYVNSRSKLISFTILACPSEFRSFLVQYSTNLEDSRANVSTVNLKLNELEEPKYVVPALE